MPSPTEPAEELLCDSTGDLHARLGAGQPSLCLVPPDGHLGFRAAPPCVEPLRSHLALLFGAR